MSEKVIKISDISGKQIESEKDRAVITVTFPDKRKGSYHLDATTDEALELANKGTKIVEAAS